MIFSAVFIFSFRYKFMDYVIRPAKENDIEQIQRIEEESFACPFSGEQFLKLYLSYKKIFFVAGKNKEILGYIAGVRGFGKITIASFAVKEEYRKRGIATGLMRHFIKKAKTMVKTVELQARVSNKPAIFFYEKMGFTCRNILSGYYPDKEDAILYIKIF